MKHSPSSSGDLVWFSQLFYFDFWLLKPFIKQKGLCVRSELNCSGLLSFWTWWVKRGEADFWPLWLDAELKFSTLQWPSPTSWFVYWMPDKEPCVCVRLFFFSFHCLSAHLAAWQLTPGRWGVGWDRFACSRCVNHFSNELYWLHN